MRVRFIISCAVAIACGNHEPQQQPTAPTSQPTASASAIATVSPSASASAAPSASAVVEAPPPGKPLKETLATAKSIQLVWRERLDTKEGFSIAIKTDSAVKGIVSAFGADQVPQGMAPRINTTFAFTFQDAAGKTIATIGLASSPTMSESGKKYGRIDFPDGTYAGIAVGDYADLQKKLKALKVDLP